MSLPASFIASLAEVLPPHPAVKLEEPPAATKIAELRQLTGAFRIFGGLGSVSLLQELDAGADGTIDGFALPETLVRESVSR